MIKVTDTLRSEEMNQPSSQAFNATVEERLSFLKENGFIVRNEDREDTTLTAAVTFRGQNVAVCISLDRRDSCIDCYLSRVKDGKEIRNNVEDGYWGHFHAFLVKHRGYRGSFREFKNDEDIGAWHELEVVKYARALKKLAPDVVSDSKEIFESN